MFTDRIDAGHQLAKKLFNYKKSNGIILAIPRGGVPVGKVIADELDLPFEMVISKKISHPLHKEYAIGAVSLETSVLDDAAEISERYIEAETKKIRQLLRERFQWYLKNNKFLPITNKPVIVVDDGIATGYTMLSALDLLAQHQPSKIIVAVPVASPRALSLLKAVPYVNEVICLHAPENFQAVGQFYIKFGQVSDEEVKEIFGGIGLGNA